MAVSVRIALAKDEKAVMALLIQLLGSSSVDGEPVDRSTAASATYRELLSGARGQILLAEDQTGPLGVLTLSFNMAIRYGGEYAQIEELIVDPDARGKNVGGTLVKACIEAARARKCREIGLYAMEGNVAFYEKYGFSLAGHELRQRLSA